MFSWFGGALWCSSILFWPFVVLLFSQSQYLFILLLACCQAAVSLSWYRHDMSSRGLKVLDFFLRIFALKAWSKAMSGRN